MRKEFSRHPVAYSILLMGLVVITTLFLAAWPNLLWQRLAILTMGVFYFSWGMVTHVKTERLSRRVIWEYLGISLLATLLLFLITV